MNIKERKPGIFSKVKLTACAVVVILGAGQMANAGAQSIYASPTGGGTACSASAPCSLEGAQAAARVQMASATSDVHVLLLDGTYSLTAPWQFAAADSGKNGHNIVWTSAPGAKPIISGAKRITGWKLVDTSKNIWGAPVPSGTRTLQIFVNGALAVRARSSQGAQVKDADGRTIYKACDKTTCSYTKAGLAGAPSDVLNVKYPQDLEVVIHAHWRDFHCPISAFSGSTVQVAQPCWNNTTIDSKNSWSLASPKGADYAGVDWFENAYEFLGTPGQFYLDSRAGFVYYVPRANENLATADVELPVLESLVNLQGAASQPVQNIQFNNLKFQYSTWLQPAAPGGYVSLQAGYLVIGDKLTKIPDNGEGMTRSATAVNVLGGNNITFTNDSFANLGEGGLTLAGGTQNSSVKNSQFINLSGAGVFAGDTTANPVAPDPVKSGKITIAGNQFQKVAQEYRDNVAVMGGFLDGITIDHNTISELPYSGISVGWGWHYEPPSTESNIAITNNRIQHVMQTLFDGGGIYTQGYSTPTSIISGNYIDMSGAQANGVYCDEYSNNFNVNNNVILGRGKFPPLAGTTAHFFSAWASYSGNINIANNWTDGGEDQHNPGSTKTWKNNSYNIPSNPLPSGAQTIYVNSGMQASTDGGASSGTAP